MQLATSVLISPILNAQCQCHIYFLFSHNVQARFPGAVEDDDFEPAPETLLSLRKLELLSAEAAKLKQMKVLNCIPQDRLVRLLNILDRHIRDSVRLPLNPEPVSQYIPYIPGDLILLQVTFRHCYMATTTTHFISRFYDSLFDVWYPPLPL